MDGTVYPIYNYAHIMGLVISAVLEVEGEFLVLVPHTILVSWFTIIL